MCPDVVYEKTVEEERSKRRKTTTTTTTTRAPERQRMTTLIRLVEPDQSNPSNSLSSSSQCTTRIGAAAAHGVNCRSCSRSPSTSSCVPLRTEAASKRDTTDGGANVESGEVAAEKDGVSGTQREYQSILDKVDARNGILHTYISNILHEWMPVKCIISLVKCVGGFLMLLLFKVGEDETARQVRMEGFFPFASLNTRKSI